jgi:hypothetical protein
MEEVRDLYLVTQRKPLEAVEPNPFLRWVLRRYFAWRGFACRSHDGDCDQHCYASIEYRGVFDDPAAARYASNCDGGAVKPIPYNAALPEETVQYKAGDVPQSEASSWYRAGVPLPFEAVRRGYVNRQLEDLKSVEGRLTDLSECIEGKCVKAS